jgi:hypothetical protein
VVEKQFIFSSHIMMKKFSVCLTQRPASLMTFMAVDKLSFPGLLEESLLSVHGCVKKNDADVKHLLPH